ncbi:hypothetical protein ACFWYS_00005, partial [Streptomyces sp. NPDC059010]
MAPVTSITANVNAQLSDALTAALPGTVGDALLRRSDRADFQANGILALAKKAKSNPRELATQVVGNIVTGDVIKEVEVSGPGFLNITVTDRAIIENLAAGGGGGGGRRGGGGGGPARTLRGSHETEREGPQEA